MKINKKYKKDLPYIILEAKKIASNTNTRYKQGCASFDYWPGIE